MTNNEERGYKSDVRRVAALSSLISVIAFAWYFFGGQILLYGDAVAHINIARRVFDSRTPGPLQLGTVWLPVPHVAMIPFVIGHQMWKSGWGGSVPSMIAFVLATVGIFRLVRARASRPTAWLAAAFFAFNPNLLYMQSTAMTESIFLATFVWSVVYVDEFLRGLFQDISGLPASLEPGKALERCAMVLAAAILTRYDGWVLAALVGVIVTVALVRRLWKTRVSVHSDNWLLWGIVAPVVTAALVKAQAQGKLDPPMSKRLLRSYLYFLILCALTPTLWLAHNYAISARPLDFLNGPYSAKAIEARSTKPGDVPHPGTNDMKTSAIFFLKDAKLNVAEGKLQPFLFALALTGTLVAVLAPGRFGALLLLWVPLPFYAYSVAYGSVPIFMPVWWPHSYYNVRYGLELLPVFAVFIALNYEWFRDMPPLKLRAAVVGVLALLTIASMLDVQRRTPICLREAIVNSRGRILLEQKLAMALKTMPDDSVILMTTGEYVGALQRAGIPLSRVVWEGAHPEWDEAIAAPAKHADYIVAIKGDQVWYATRLFPERLEKYVEFENLFGKPPVTVYRAKR